MQNGMDHIKSNGAKRKCSEMGFGGQVRCEHDVETGSDYEPHNSWFRRWTSLVCECEMV